MNNTLNVMNWSVAYPEIWLLGSSSDSAIWAVYPSAKYVMPRLRVLLDFLGDWFRDVGTVPVPERSRLVGTTAP